MIIQVFVTQKNILYFKTCLLNLVGNLAYNTIQELASKIAYKLLVTKGEIFNIQFLLQETLLYLARIQTDGMAELSVDFPQPIICFIIQLFFFSFFFAIDVTV